MNTVTKRYAITLVMLTAFVVCAVATVSTARSPYFDWTFDPISFSPPIPDRFELDNGLIVHVLPDDQLPVVTLTAIVRAGAVSVAPTRTGLAGIVGDALVTGGTASRTPDQVDDALEMRGIRWSGSIGDESASFSMRCLARDLDTALALFAELLRTPRFDSAKVELAIDNVREDLRRQNDSPGRITSREFAKLLYGDHPYGRFPTNATVDAITRNDIVDFHKQFFHPNNIILAVSGKVDTDDMQSRLRHVFGDWPQMAVEPAVAPQVPMSSGGVYQINKDISQTNIRFGHLGIDRKNPDRYAVRVMNDILGGGGFTSRMVERVRSDSGWAYSVGTRFTTSDQPGMFYASCQTKAETTVKTLSLMEWVIDDLLQNGVTDEELTVAKDAILNSDVFKFETPVEIVERYAWLEYNEFPLDQLSKDVEAIRAVTRADVNAVARKYLNPDNYVILVVGNAELFDAPLPASDGVITLSLE